MGWIAHVPGETRGERNIRWIEYYCRVPEGKDVGKRVKLRDFQRDALLKIYDNPYGTRLAIISFAKKNAKSSLCGFLILLHVAGPEAKRNSQIPSTAQSKEQAAVVFQLAAKIVRLNPELDAYINVRDTAKQLVCPALGTVYKALSADAHTAHGQSPIFAIHDELGQVQGPISELYNAIENAMGAHEDPMSIIISTQAPTDFDLLSQLIDKGLEGDDPHTVVILYVADEDLDPFSDEAIKQANPAAGDFLNMKELRKQADNARRLPAQEPLYRNYTLNQRVEASSPFVTKSVWKANGGSPSKLGPVYAGLDLSETNDLTAFVMASPVDGLLHVRPIFWLPKEGLVERSRKDHVPYDVWEKKGFIQGTPGRSIEYKYVAGVIAEAFQEYDIRKVAFDRYNMKHLRSWLVEAGLTESFIDDRFEEFGQGFVSMSPALRELESMLLNEKVRHGNHLVLEMCARNAVVETDPAGNRKLTKKKSRGRIDGMVALAMAASLASREMNQKKVYDVKWDNVFEEMEV